MSCIIYLQVNYGLHQKYSGCTTPQRRGRRKGMSTALPLFAKRLFTVTAHSGWKIRTLHLKVSALLMVMNRHLRNLKVWKENH